jgi:hypothetical protein
MHHRLRHRLQRRRNAVAPGVHDHWLVDSVAMSYESSK